MLEFIKSLSSEQINAIALFVSGPFASWLIEKLTNIEKFKWLTEKSSDIKKRLFAVTTAALTGLPIALANSNWSQFILTIIMSIAASQASWALTKVKNDAS